MLDTMIDHLESFPHTSYTLHLSESTQEAAFHMIMIVPMFETTMSMVIYDVVTGCFCEFIFLEIPYEGTIGHPFLIVVVFECFFCSMLFDELSDPFFF